MKMRAIEVSKFGGPSSLAYRDDVDAPVLAEDEVLIRNHFAGVNFKDLLYDLRNRS